MFVFLVDKKKARLISSPLSISGNDHESSQLLWMVDKQQHLQLVGDKGDS